MTMIEYVEGTGDYSYSYSGSESLNELSFSNDGSGEATVAVNGQTITVKSSETFEVRTPQAFTAVEITVTGDWRLVVGR